MSRYHSYLRSAKEILGLYKGQEPFAAFIKKFFAGYKKFGSSDRKQISHLCYCYFRVGRSIPAVETEQRIITALFLCSTEPNKLLGELKPEWTDKASLVISDKIEMIDQPGLPDTIFPWVDELSDGIDAPAFSLSHLQQPDLFLRLRPGKKEIIKQKLQAAGVQFTAVTDTCLSLPNSSKIDELIELDKEAVVQDYSSQQVGSFFQYLQTSNTGFSVWDCCAASGGKSIMAKDILGEIDLTVSDVRESIIVNLKKRFAVAGIKEYKSFITDLAKPVSNLNDRKFDLIIADVPCSGSGTWGRTPEQLFYFDGKKIDEYAALQKKIVENIIPHLAPGGQLLYITCSVFKKENEEAITLLKGKFHLQVIKIELLKGYDKKADTMFAALLKTPL